MRDGELIFSAIPPAELAGVAARAAVTGDFSPLADWTAEGTPPANTWPGAVYLGDGTGSGQFAWALESAGVPFELVGERDTTRASRGLYWRLHPPSGLWRLVPLSMRVPPRPTDDLAAWAIAEIGEAKPRA